MDRASLALLSLGRALLDAGYSFTTPTPASHQRVNARPASATARTLRDVFGWSRPFAPEVLPESMRSLLAEAGALETVAPGRLRSAVRWSSLDGRLFVHSAYPTTASDAVFFGPDTYRFVAFLRRHARPAGCVVDVGCGSGAGGLVWAGLTPRLVLADINPRALVCARVNAALAGAEGVETVVSDVLAAVDGAPSVVVANPPYLVDDEARVYRHGGAALGTELAVRIVRESLARLAPGGQVLLYTGAPVVAGRDLFLDAVTPLCAQAGALVHYEEIDPDVFGEELERPIYADAGVERVAAVGLVASMPAR